MSQAIIFDIDGTLADISRRRHFLLQEEIDWEGFYKNMGTDTPILPIRAICGCMLAMGGVAQSFGYQATYDVVFCTGRPSNYRGATISWLRKHILPLHYSTDDIHLYMRKAGDRRPDYVVKEELIDQMKKDGFMPFLVFEDRKQVVDMWRRHGIQCCQVAEGNF